MEWEGRKDKADGIFSLFAFEEMNAHAQWRWKISDAISFQANEQRNEHRIFSDTLQEGRK